MKLQLTKVALFGALFFVTVNGLSTILKRQAITRDTPEDDEENVINIDIQEMEPDSETVPVIPEDCTCDIMEATADSYECGADGKSYPTQCFRECNGVELEHAGMCKMPDDPCDCPFSDNSGPVCAKDGTSYGSECYLTCYGGELDHEGECDPLPDDVDCFCVPEGGEVCGVDGQTYENECVLSCAGVEMDYLGACDPSLKPEVEIPEMPSLGTDIEVAEIIDIEEGEEEKKK